MQTYQLNKTVGVVGVPIDFTNIAGLTENHLYCWTTSLTIGMGDYPYAIPIIKGNWQFLSLASDMTEEKAKQILGGKGIYCSKYANFILNDYSCNTALESFNSWLKANSIKGNTVILIKG